MTSKEPSYYPVAEADADDESIDKDQLQSLQNYLRERLLENRTRNYSNTGIADAKAIEKISSEFEILVFGPARVGKSTLIRELSGDENIRTSAGLDACTQTATAYTDQFGVTWWDTRGIEKWTNGDAESFLKNTFFNRHIIPRGAIFCRTSGALADTSVLRQFFDELQSHSIPVFYVITRWPLLTKREQIEMIDEAVQLLGGVANGIYPVKRKPMNTNIQQVQIVSPSSGGGCFGSRRVSNLVITNSQTPISPPMMQYRALECRSGNSYIVPVNSRIDELNHNSLSTTFPVMNMNLLRHLITVKTCRGDNEEQKLIDLYKNQMSFVVKLGYHVFEVLDDLGFGTSSFGLNRKEEETYRQLKQGGRNQHIAVPLVKAVMDKIMRKALLSVG